MIIISHGIRASAELLHEKSIVGRQEVGDRHEVQLIQPGRRAGGAAGGGARADCDRNTVDVAGDDTRVLRRSSSRSRRSSSTTSSSAYDTAVAGDGAGDGVGVLGQLFHVPLYILSHEVLPRQLEVVGEVVDNPIDQIADKKEEGGGDNLFDIPHHHHHYYHQHQHHHYQYEHHHRYHHHLTAYH